MQNTSQPTNRSNLIYLVDDEPMLCELVAELLGLHGHTTKTFELPSEALAEAQKPGGVMPNLLITDYVMGEMSGLDLIDAFKELKPELVTILYSGSVSGEIHLGKIHAPDFFLNKPFLPNELTNLVAKALKLPPPGDI